MNWHIPLILVLAFSLFQEVLRMVKHRSLRDIVFYAIVWGLAVLAVIADRMELPGLRPLDWIEFLMQPVNKLMP